MKRTKGQRAKGQMFLMAAIIIVSALVILKASSMTPTVVMERRVLEVRLEDEIFANVVEEFKKAVWYSIHEPLNITSNAFDFGNFTRDKTYEHSLIQKLLYLGITANRTTGVMNVSLVNLLGSTISANLTLNDSQSDSSSVADYAQWDTSFTFTAGTHYTLTAVYDDESQNITIATKPNRDVYVAFFDLSLIGPAATHRELYQKRYSL